MTKPAFPARGARRRLLLTLAATMTLAGCAPRDRPLDDREKIVRSVLTLLASTGQPVCIDDQTQENALAVFREMTLAPRASRADLRWYPPTPLRPDTRVTTRQLRQSELGNQQVEIDEPAARTDALAGLAQFRLDGAARRLMRPAGEAEESVAIRRWWVPDRVTARWWPLNRMRKDCWPLFTVSNPVRDRGVAFVTVRAEHWGTLYALQRAGNEWTVVAEWSRWLY